MRTQRSTSKSQSNHNLAARVGRWSVQHRRKAILGWLAFVFVALAVGFNLVPQKNLEPNEGMPGESGKAGQVLKDAYPEQQESRRAGARPVRSRSRRVMRSSSPPSLM